MPKKRNFDKNIGNSITTVASGSVADSIMMIDVDNLIESPDNYFEINRIDELADTIIGQGAVMSNLIVKPINDSGEYEIVSGHRRWFAVKKLIAEGKSVSRYLPCLVREYVSGDDKLLDIALMNLSARSISDAELWKSYHIINDILQKKKDLGEKFGGVQKKLSELLGVSTGQIAKMQIIDKRAIDEIKEAVENGDMAINTAEIITNSYDKDEQKALTSKKPLSEIKPKDVEKVKKSTINGNFSNEEEIDNDYSGSSSEGMGEEKVTIDDNFLNEDEGNNDSMSEGMGEEKLTINGNFSEVDDTGSENEDEQFTIDDNFGENDVCGECANFLENDKLSMCKITGREVKSHEFACVGWKSKEYNKSKQVSSGNTKQSVSPAPDNLYSYVVENDDIIFEILNNYLNVTDDQRERNVISNLKDFMRYARNVSDSRDVLTGIFNTYLGMTDSKEEKDVITSVKKLIQL